MQTLLEQIRMMFWNIIHRPSVADFADILLVAVIIYGLLKLTRETRASAVLKGLGIIIAATLFSDFLGLTALNWLLNSVLQNGALVLVVLFQPEVRKALEQIGSGTFRSSRVSYSERTAHDVMEISKCLSELSNRRVGALIVMERNIGLKDVIETGTELNANISASLLENIFEPNTPLHDGAVVIRGTKIMAAACILPLTDRSVSSDLGTRHRAAIGVTETTDAVSLIVSEETGIISYAVGGKITRSLTREDVETLLTEMLIPGSGDKISSFTQKLHIRKGGGRS